MQKCYLNIDGPCREYKGILKDCIVDEGRNQLLFELKRPEAQALCRAFDEKTHGRRSQARPMPNATGADTQMVLAPLLLIL